MNRILMRMGSFALLASAACSNPSDDAVDGPVGSVTIALTAASAHDVVAVQYQVGPLQEGCGGPNAIATTVALESENAPPSVQPGGDAHRFADALFTLDAGDYIVCAQPLAQGNVPSAECAATSTSVTVFESVTTEVLLVSQCDGDASGGLDGTTILNDPPHIDVLTVQPSKFISTCQVATMEVDASDPNGDSILYSWNVDSGPSTWVLGANDDTATFDPADPGDYTLSVTAFDTYGATASLSFPIHVSAPDVLFSESFADNAQGWTLGPEWQIGAATASSGQVYGNPDPADDHSASLDNGVAGVVIGGNASTGIHDYYYLTSPVVDAEGASSLSLEFWRWLNSDYTPYMQNSVEVFDGTQWVVVWQSAGSPGVQDAAWTQQALDISAYANAALQVRFGFNVGNVGVFTVSSWNLDDVTIVANCD
jgi:PKD domain-containing protein